MSEFLFLLSLALALAVLTVLGYLAKRFPWFGLLAGSGIVATAVYLWQRTSMRDFRSDGSAAGAVLMVFFGLFEIVLVSIGIGLIGTAFVSRRFGSTGENKRPSSTSTRTAQAATDGTRVIADAGVSPALPTSPASKAAQPEKISRGMAWFALLLGAVIAFPAMRLITGFSKDLICGKKGCIDFFGLLSWVKSWGGPVALGFCYLAIASMFFMFAYNAFFPAPKPRAWLDKYRKVPRATGATRTNTPPSR